MKKSIWISAITALFAGITASFGQDTPTLAQQLGYPADAKLLIVHADDLGCSHSANAASIAAFEKKGITCGSIMVPCPWFAEFAAYAREHPGLDVGIHLTLNAEWKYYKWPGVSSSNEIPSLLDEHGYFYASNEDIARNADPAEVEKEFRAQIERAIAFGVKPTHFDTHMASAGVTPELFQIYLKLGKEYKTPVLLPRYFLMGLSPEAREQVASGYVLLDNLLMMGAAPKDLSWSEAYRQMIGQIKPGLNELIVHLGYDDDEMRAICVDHDDFGAAWRQRDLDYVLSDEFRMVLEENNIQLIGWREIRDYIRAGNHE
jgi:predicted glycoside hydrolase/deacetylase ChbG (UPF0249 family)